MGDNEGIAPAFAGTHTPTCCWLGVCSPPAGPLPLAASPPRTGQLSPLQAAPPTPNLGWTSHLCPQKPGPLLAPALGSTLAHPCLCPQGRGGGAVCSAVEMEPTGPLGHRAGQILAHGGLRANLVFLCTQAPNRRTPALRLVPPQVRTLHRPPPHTHTRCSSTGLAGVFPSPQDFRCGHPVICK